MSQSNLIQIAAAKDFKAVTDLLFQQKLPIADIPEELPHFFIVKESERILGVIGMELYGKNGLLRSLATDPDFRKKGIASELIAELFSYAKRLGLKEIYLLTETAEKYFTKRGFRKIDRGDAPDGIKQSAEFTHLCPSTAVLMKMEIQ